ncbi:MAG: dephospho-CoA kinase [Nitrospirales bacterium]
MLCCSMLIVGLTGGLASGKSTIAQLFQQHGANVLDADCLTREVVKPRRAAWKDIVQAFGQGILTDHQTVNRAALAKIVFKNPSKLKQLTDILHPRVASEQARLARIITQKHPDAVIIYDAAMLIESGAYKRMDQVILIKAKRETQLQRASKRNGMTKAEAIRRIRQQMPLREKLPYADHVIDGELPLQQLHPVVGELYNTFRIQARQ